MISLFQTLFSSPFFQYACLALIGTSICSGIVGSYVVVKRMTFLSGSLAHAVLSGMGIALYLNRTYGLSSLSPIYGAILSSLILAWIMGFIRIHYREREDAIIATIWALGMSIGIVFSSLTPGYNIELMSFLLGNILWVGAQDLITLGILDCVVLVLSFWLHHRLVAICFDEDQAKLQGIRVPPLYLLLLSMIAITIVLLVQIVGIVLVLALLTIPPSIAGRLSKRLSSMIFIAMGLGLCFSFLGLVISYLWNWPAGATIALCHGTFYLIFLIFGRKTSMG